ncbi:MAG: hypothetical protein ABI461_13595 [Polyangiaceae bacterium]
MPNEKPKAADKPPIHRRDNSGHLDPKYAADLDARRKAAGGKDDDKAFLDGKSRSNDPLAEELGESFVKTATSGEDSIDDDLEEVVAEESGGPFVETTGGTEFAPGEDGSNPKGADREPFPTT